jgi:DNA repair protein RadC
LEWILRSVDGALARRWADRLIDEFGSLANVLAAPLERIASTLGGKPAPAHHLKAFASVMLHALRCQMHVGPVFAHWEDIIDYLTATMTHSRIETVRGLFVDSAHRLIADELLGSGTINACDVYPREVARRAVELEASGIILAHNHPSGTIKFSGADQQITWAVDRACKTVGVRLHDHLLICRTGYASLRAEYPLWAH